MNVGDVAESNQRRSSRRCVSPDNELVAVQHIYVRTSARAERSGERSPLSIGIFNSLDEGGNVDAAKDGLPNAWKLTLSVQARKRLFDLLEQFSGKKSTGSKSKRKRQLSPTEENTLRDRRDTIEACKTRFVNGMERLPRLRHELVQLEVDLSQAREVLLQSSESLTEVETTHIEVAKERRLVHYILEGESGVIDVGGRHVIFVDKLQRKIKREHLSEEDCDEDDINKRTAMDYIPVCLNKVDFWLPVGVKAIMTHYFSKLFNDSKIVRRIRDVFSEKRERCIMSREGLRMLTAGSLHNSGRSDKYTLFCFCFAWKTLSAEIGLQISNDSITRG